MGKLRHTMKTVQTKLTIVGLVAAVLAAVLLRNVYIEYLALANFQQTTRVSVAASNVARSLTLERQMAYQASAFLGEGTVSLRDETLSLKLRPRPKDRSLISLRAPLWIDGTFKNPEFHPDYGRIGLRGALALALGNIAPPAALLATLELGPGKDSTCGGRYAK